MFFVAVYFGLLWTQCFLFFRFACLFFNVYFLLPGGRGERRAAIPTHAAGNRSRKFTHIFIDSVEPSIQEKNASLKLHFRFLTQACFYFVILAQDEVLLPPPTAASAQEPDKVRRKSHNNSSRLSWLLACLWKLLHVLGLGRRLKTQRATTLRHSEKFISAKKKKK